MSRIRVLLHQPKLALGALCTILLAGGAVAGSGANFSASEANPTNTFTAGTLAIDNSREDVAILEATNLRPGGDAQSGTVDIKNSGSLDGAFTLTRSAPVDSDQGNPMSAKLNVKVVDCGEFDGTTAPTCDSGDSVVYEGTLADMGTTGNEIDALGNYAADEQHRYKFDVALDGSAGNAYQGDSSTVAFEFNAAS
jgi:spore coat-associated protein N